MADTFQIRQDEPGCAEDANALLERFRRATSALVRIYTSTASGCGVLVRVHDMICIVTAAHCVGDSLSVRWQGHTDACTVLVRQRRHDVAVLRFTPPVEDEKRAQLEALAVEEFSRWNLKALPHIEHTFLHRKRRSSYNYTAQREFRAACHILQFGEDGADDRVFCSTGIIAARKGRSRDGSGDQITVAVADSKYGSSGSAVFDAAWRYIGVLTGGDVDLYTYCTLETYPWLLQRVTSADNAADGLMPPS